jgi:outer membrane protein OmpA-like peptidoglycan-associated protein
MPAEREVDPAAVPAPPEKTPGPPPAAARVPALSPAAGAMLGLQAAVGNQRAGAIARALQSGRGAVAGNAADPVAMLQRQAAPAPAPPAPAGPIVAGPGIGPPQAVPTIPGRTGDAAQELAAADAFHSGPDLQQAIQPTSGIGGFTARYSPSSDKLTIVIKGSIVFKDGIVDAGGGTFTPGDPGLAGVIARIPPAGPRRERFLRGFRWPAAEKRAFTRRLESIVEKAWSAQHEFHVNRPQWEWIGAKVAVDVQVRQQEATGRAADDHFSIDAIKTPVEGTGDNDLQAGETVNSQVAGDADRTNAFDGSMTLGSNDIRPSRDPLLATVPVFFGNDDATIFPAERAKIVAFANQWQGAAPGTAGSRPASVELKAMTSASGTAEHNRDLAQRRADAVRAELVTAGFNNVNTRVVDANLGASAARGSNAREFRRVDMVPDGGRAQTVAVHEFGHAFGLDDEYGAQFGSTQPAAGTPVAHNAATQAMTDATGANLPGAVVENNNNIMSVGNAVQPQHYSTFHEALVAITGISEWALGPKQARPQNVTPPAGPPAPPAGGP